MVVCKRSWVIIAVALVFSGCDFKTMSSGVTYKEGFFAAISTGPSGTPSPSPSATASPLPLLLPPASVTYSSNPASYMVAMQITPNSPSVTGSAATSFSVSPSLPSGLSLNPTTGMITGTPTAVSAASSYTVLATNGAGSAQTNLSIAVATNIVAPANLSYSSLSPVFVKGVAITALSPTSQGGAPTSYSIAPALSAGLAFNTASGVISGTPTALLSATSYIVTATNSAGSTNVTLSITVNDLAPATITYSSNPASYQVASVITANSPMTTGGTPTSYSITPALPAGLAFNTTTGVITGTPTAVSAAVNYTAKAINSAGFAQVVISITVATNIVAPSMLTYSNLAPVFTKGAAITPLSPTSQGGAPTSYAIAPALPAGLAFNTTNGVISGTPTALVSATPFQITATNSAGAATATITITVNDMAPATLTYSSNPASYKVATAVTANSPTTTGGTPTSYSITPALPAGLAFSTTTGVITGTPTAVSAATNYTAKATNSAGFAQVVISIAVATNIVAPSNLSYSNLAPVFTKGVAITALSPTSQGGAPTSYGVAPALPAGLSFSTTTGVISGTPTTLSSASAYVVTATNAGGSTTVSLTITVNDMAPATLAYSTNPATYKVTVAVAANSPTTTGGMPTSFSITPALPAGLAFSATTGVITGTPTSITAAANYTVKAINSVGFAQATLNIAVQANIVAPTNLTYSNLSPVFTKGTAITALSPTNMGGTPTSYAITPALPAGLSFSTTTGTISGTPTTVLVMTPFQVTASNSAGSASVTLAITVKDIAPATLTYSSAAIVYPKGSAITANVAATTGGAPTSYAVAPALTAGLSLNATSGAISGTPTAAALPSTFTVTATNSGGSITAAIKIGVSDPSDPNANYTYIQTNLMTTSCNFCHKVGGVPGAANYTTYAGLVASVVPNSPLTSPLYIRTAPGAPSPMPPGGTITSVQSFAILNWIALGAPDNSVTPSPTPSASPTPVGGTLLVGNDERLRLANRTFIASALKDIFGSSSAAAITKLITAPGYVDVLGGPCNAYSDLGEINYGSLSQGSDCTSAAGSLVAAIPMATTARGALMTRACDLIVSQDAAVLNAASLALGTTVTATTIATMDAAAIVKAYDLFYYGRPMNAAIAADLLAISSSGANAMDSWRYPLLTLCYAPDWQVK